MELIFLFKWASSGGGNCPAVYATDGGDIVVQGWNLDGGEEAQLRDRAANEGAVRIPYEMAEQIADMVIARRGQ